MVTPRAVRWATMVGRGAGAVFVVLAVAAGVGALVEHRWFMASCWLAIAATSAVSSWRDWQWESWPRGTGDVLKRQGELIVELRKTLMLCDAALRLPTRPTRTTGDRPS